MKMPPPPPMMKLTGSDIDGTRSSEEEDEDGNYKDGDDYEGERRRRLEDHVLGPARLRSRFDLREIHVELAWYHPLPPPDAHASRETFASSTGSLRLELFVSDG
jgi:hypothetical protein